MANMRIIDRALPERAKLMFYFPSPNPQEDYYIVELPFFENVSIKERKRARYQKYSTIARSSNLYTYLGADSRQFDLSFFLTLPQIEDEHSELTKSSFMKLGINDREDKNRMRFKSPEHTGEVGVEGGIANPSVKVAYQYLDLENVESTAKQVLQFHPYLKLRDKAYIKKTYLGETPGHAVEGAPGTLPNPLGLGRPGGPPALPGADYPLETMATVPDKKKLELIRRYSTIDLIIYWVNIIRTSVVNNATNPIFGPPIIRLTHGIMYENIPCLCTNYSISWEERAGYDMETLLPRRIKFSLELEEFRTGNFGDYEPGTVDGDNLAGFEAVIEYGSMDPGQLNLGAMSVPPI